MANVTWRDWANRAISQALKTAKDEGIPHRPVTDEQKARVKKLIDEAYPFGERSHHPYKVWLSERKKTLIALGIEKLPPCPGSSRAIREELEAKRVFEKS